MNYQIGSKKTCVINYLLITQVFYGGFGGIRTHDQRLKRPLLYRLSYESFWFD